MEQDWPHQNTHTGIGDTAYVGRMEHDRPRRVNNGIGGLKSHYVTINTTRKSQIQNLAAQWFLNSCNCLLKRVDAILALKQAIP